MDSIRSCITSKTDHYYWNDKGGYFSPCAVYDMIVLLFGTVTALSQNISFK